MENDSQKDAVVVAVGDGGGGVAVVVVVDDAVVVAVQDAVDQQLDPSKDWQERQAEELHDKTRADLP